MNLNIQRPIAFFDLETTGINIASDRIVEISILKVEPDGSKESFTFKVNPTIPIPEVTSKIHGIYDKDVENEPTFADLAHQLLEIFDNCDLGGYNSNSFDIPLIVEEFLRLELVFDVKNRSWVDVQTIFHKMEQRTLSAAYKFFCNKTLENAHSAEADTNATFEILEAQLEKYSDEIENDVKFLHKFSQRKSNLADFAGRIAFNGKGVAVFNFGKHKGVPVADVLTKEPGYYHWIMNNDFPLYTKQVLKEIKLKMMSAS
jgi:DNA polymerase-3 subunit epsilon